MEKHITHYILFAYFLFIAGYFLTPNGVDHYKFLVLFVLLPGLLLSRQLYDSVNHDSTFALLVVYLLYTLASAPWSETPDYAQLGRHAAQALLILFFVALLHNTRATGARLPITTSRGTVNAVAPSASSPAEHPWR